MNTKIIIKIPQEQEKEYEIVIGSGLVKGIASYFDQKKYSKVLILSDKFIWNLHKGVFDSLEYIPILIEQGEKNKNLNTYNYIQEQLILNKADRKSLLINFGGGVVTDLGGFVAGTYMRGIDFISIPTTLLSQVDASVGGKTGLNLNNIKNILGVFSQPKLVLIDAEFLKTLSERDIASGMAENIKHSIIADVNFFNILARKNFLEFSYEDWIEVLTMSIDVKAKVVMQDEKETGIRKILNFGHTAGHSIESLFLETDEPLLHGEAVSIGMVIEAKISESLGYITNHDFEKILDVLKLHRLPIVLPRQIDKKEFLSRILKDKKTAFGSAKWSLLDKIGGCSFDNTINEETILKALEYVNK